MNNRLWLAELEHAAARAKSAIARVKQLADRSVPEGDFALKIVARAGEYLEGQLRLGRRAATRLGEVACSGSERRRIYKELQALLARVHRVALYAQAQVFRLDGGDHHGASLLGHRRL